MLLKDQIAIITGGAGVNGLGFATARLMAAQGARVAILDLERADPAAAAAQLGAGHIGLVADVTDKASCDAATAAVLQAFGRIDTLVNNAGITQPVKTLEITGADYDRILDVSLRGTLYMSQAVLPAMRAQQSGSIICISSVSAQRGGGILGGPHYSAAKAGVLVLLPSHKSHIDYLVEPIVLDDAGVRPPLIAAGINLFGGPLGLLHRHITGAIPIRRSTKDPAYLITLKAYIAAEVKEGTELLKDVEAPGRYLVIDRWESADTYNTFVAANREEYMRRVDEARFLYDSELRFGTFESA